MLSRMCSLSGRMNIVRVNIGFFTEFKKIKPRRISFVLGYLRMILWKISTAISIKHRILATFNIKKISILTACMPLTYVSTFSTKLGSQNGLFYDLACFIYWPFLLHFGLLLKNHWAKLDFTWYETSLIVTLQNCVQWPYPHWRWHTLKNQKYFMNLLLQNAWMEREHIW
jgi:hypothetical protein